MTRMHRNSNMGPFNMKGAFSFAICVAVLCIATGSEQHANDASVAGRRRSLLREGSGHHHHQQGHGIVAGAAVSMTLSQKLAHHLRQGREMMRNLNIFEHDDDKVIKAQKGYCGSVNPDKDCTGKKNAKNNNNNSGSGENNGDSGSSGSSDIGVSDVAKAIMSVVKDSGDDKSIDRKKLRDKVQDELDVSSDDSDEFDDFKDKFKDALDKLEDKDLIKIKDGVVSAVISGDDSQDEKKDKDKGDDDDDDDDDDDGKNDRDQDSSGGDDDDNEKNPDKPSGDDDDDDDDDNGDKPKGDSTADTGKGAIGAECQRNRDCESSMCSDGVCTEMTSGILVGEDCASDLDCESGICGSEGTCEESRTDDGDDPTMASPTASPTTSEPTSSPTMSVTSPETDATSVVETTDAGAIRDACEEDGDCESNLCIDGLCSVELKANGEDCEADIECQSDFCSSAGICDSISNDTEGVPTPAPVPETNPAPAPAPSAFGDDDDNDSRDSPSRPNEVESFSGDLSIPYNFQISTEGGELTPEDIADIEEALGILSQQIAEETFPDGGAGGRRLRQAIKMSRSSRQLLVVYNENNPAEVTDAQQAECVVSADPGPCYDVDAETTLTLVDEDRGAVREEFRDSMEDAIADGLLDSILREINPDTTLTATVIPSDEPSDGGQGNSVDESREPEDGADATTRSTNLSPGGIAGIAILAAGVTAAVAFAIVAGRRRNNDDDNSRRSDLDSSDDKSPRDASGLHEDSSLRRLRAAAAAAGSTQQPGVYPDAYHQDAAHMASTRVINPGLQEDEYLSSDDDEPTGAPGSFPTEAPPAPTDNASTPLIAAAAVTGGAALAAQHQGIIDESSTADQSMYEDDAQLQDSYDEAIDAHIRDTNEDADVNQILSALPGSPPGAEKGSDSPDSSFEDDIRAAITSMEGEDHVRDVSVSPERELPDALYSSASEPESEKEVDTTTEKKKSSGISGLIRKLSSQHLGGASED